MIDQLRELRAREFPWAVRGDQTFLNHASTGPLPQRAVDALQELTALRATPWRYSQEIQFGTLAKARAGCARLIGAAPSEIACMVNTSYGLNLAALDGPRVRALVLSWVSFATGYRIDVARLGRACRERGIWFVLDAIQGVGAAPLDVAAEQVDIVACGAQKWLLSPWGTGFVWVRPDLVQSLRPVDVSWMATRNSDDFTRLIDYDFTYRDDARRFEMITLPYQDFGGLNASLDLFLEVGLAEVYEQVARLTGRIVQWALGSADVRLVTPADPTRRAGIVAVAPRDPVAASDRLTAAGVTHSLREGAIRLSPHFYNTEEEIDTALALLEG